MHGDGANVNSGVTHCEYHRVVFLCVAMRCDDVWFKILSFSYILYHNHLCICESGSSHTRMPKGWRYHHLNKRKFIYASHFSRCASGFSVFFCSSIWFCPKWYSLWKNSSEWGCRGMAHKWKQSYFWDDAMALLVRHNIFSFHSFQTARWIRRNIHYRDLYNVVVVNLIFMDGLLWCRKCTSHILKTKRMKIEYISNYMVEKLPSRSFGSPKIRSISSFLFCSQWHVVFDFPAKNRQIKDQLFKFARFQATIRRHAKKRGFYARISNFNRNYIRKKTNLESYY